jgi:hypothetical protein
MHAISAGTSQQEEDGVEADIAQKRPTIQAKRPSRSLSRSLLDDGVEADIAQSTSEVSNVSLTCL